MFHTTACPGCGRKVEYIAELIGTVHRCEGCRAPFKLRGNDLRVMGRLAWATVCAVAATLGVFLLNPKVWAKVLRVFAATGHG